MPQLPSCIVGENQNGHMTWYYLAQSDASRQGEGMDMPGGV